MDKHVVKKEKLGAVGIFPTSRMLCVRILECARKPIVFDMRPASVLSAQRSSLLRAYQFFAILTITILFSVLILMMSASVSALGITPGRTNIAFEPGLEREVSVTVINSDHENVHLVVQVRGELNQSIVLENDKMHLNKNENEK